MTQPTPHAAIFDLDKTLLEGDSEALWCQFLYEKQVVGDEFVQRILQFYEDYDNGSLDIHAYEAYFLSPLTQHPLEKMLTLREEFLGRIRQLIRPGMLARVDQLRQAGATPLLITATNSFLAEPIASLLGFEHSLCSVIRREADGSYTNQLSGIPAIREGKVTLLEGWLEQQQLTLQGSWGFSDSHNDLPLLQRVSHPVAVTPDATLRAHAQAHGWEIVES